MGQAASPHTSVEPVAVREEESWPLASEVVQSDRLSVRAGKVARRNWGWRSERWLHVEKLEGDAVR